MKHDSDILKRIKTYFMRRKSAEEAHTFEREVEKDPFLYEAMEGLEGMLTSDIQQALDELDYRLDDSVKAVAWYQNWKLAASVILILGLGSTLFWLIPADQSNAEPEYTLDENGNEYNPRLKSPEFPTLEAGFAMDSMSRAVASQDSMLDGIVAAAEPQTVPEAIYKDESVVTEISDVAMNGFSASGTSEADPEEEISMVEDDLEEAQSEDILMEEEAFALSEAPRKSNAVPASNQLESKSSDYYETVSESVSKAKRDPSSTSSSSQVVPVDGMKAYRAYLNKNIRASEGMPSGTVLLSFDVDRNGRPKKVQVVNSLCTACDAEAIRLLVNGPKWSTEDKKAKGSISISFP